MVHPALRIDCAVLWAVTVNDDALKYTFFFCLILCCTEIKFLLADGSEVTGLNIVQDIGKHDIEFLWFSSVPPGNCWDSALN
jgi:hypothetical protein